MCVCEGVGKRRPDPLIHPSQIRRRGKVRGERKLRIKKSELRSELKKKLTECGGEGEKGGFIVERNTHTHIYIINIIHPERR